MSMKKFIALLLAMVMMLSFAACGETSSSEDNSSSSEQQSSNSGNSNVDSEEAKYGGHLIYAGTGSTVSLDTTQISNAHPMVQATVERLGRIDSNNNYSWNLVEDMVRDNDAKTVTIKILQGVKFHDGTELNAEVVKWNLDRYINGSQAGVIGRPASCEVTGDYEVVVHFDEYSIDWEYLLCFAYMYSKEYGEENGENAYTNWAIGTGPFKMVDYEVDAIMELERFEEYHGKRAYLDKITYLRFADTLGMVTAFINEEIGYVSISDANYIKMVEDAGYKVTDVDYTNSGCNVLWANTLMNDMWSDKRVREALFLWGIDFDSTSYAIAGDLGYHTYQWAKKGGFAWRDEKEDLYHYDKDKALELLAEAGYADGFKTELYAYTSQAIASTVLQAAYKDLGVSVNVNLVQSPNTLRDEGGHAGFWIGGYGVPKDQTQNFTSHWVPGGNMDKVWNFTAEADEIVNRIKNAQSQEEKRDAMADYVTYMCFDQVFATPLYCTDTCMYFQDYVHNYPESYEYQNIQWENIWMDGELVTR